MSIPLTGKTSLVTGGASGLGKAIAARFLAAGANVIICDINPTRLEQVSTELLPSSSEPTSSTSSSTTTTTPVYGKLKTVQVDITVPAEVESLFQLIRTEFGKLDILINNAGIMDRFDPVGDLDEKLWEKVMAVNLTAPFLLSKLAVRLMLEQEVVDGSIVNIVSTAGKAGFFAGAAYTASKHGLVGLTKNTAAFYGNKGIRCNALMVGGMNTNIVEAFMSGINEEGKGKVIDMMTAMKVPMCELDQVAGVCLALSAGPAAKLINGACLPVDHGAAAILG